MAPITGHAPPVPVVGDQRQRSFLFIAHGVARKLLLHCFAIEKTQSIIYHNTTQKGWVGYIPLCAHF